MTNSEFKCFKAFVENADRNDPIWWCGFQWLALTDRQCSNISKVLEQKRFIRNVSDPRGRMAHLLPSGLTLAKV